MCSIHQPTHFENGNHFLVMGYPQNGRFEELPSFPSHVNWRLAISQYLITSRCRFVDWPFVAGLPTKIQGEFFFRVRVEPIVADTRNDQPLAKTSSIHRIVHDMISFRGAHNTRATFIDLPFAVSFAFVRHCGAFTIFPFQFIYRLLCRTVYITR